MGEIIRNFETYQAIRWLEERKDEVKEEGDLEDELYNLIVERLEPSDDEEMSDDLAALYNSFSSHIDWDEVKKFFEWKDEQK